MANDLPPVILISILSHSDPRTLIRGCVISAKINMVSESVFELWNSWLGIKADNVQPEPRQKNLFAKRLKALKSVSMSIIEYRTESPFVKDFLASNSTMEEISKLLLQMKIAIRHGWINIVQPHKIIIEETLKLMQMKLFTELDGSLNVRNQARTQAIISAYHCLSSSKEDMQQCLDMFIYKQNLFFEPLIIPTTPDISVIDKFFASCQLNVQAQINQISEIFTNDDLKTRAKKRYMEKVSKEIIYPNITGLLNDLSERRAVRLMFLRTCHLCWKYTHNICSIAFTSNDQYREKWIDGLLQNVLIKYLDHWVDKELEVLNQLNETETYKFQGLKQDVAPATKTKIEEFKNIITEKFLTVIQKKRAIAKSSENPEQPIAILDSIQRLEQKYPGLFFSQVLFSVTKIISFNAESIFRIEDLVKVGERKKTIGRIYTHLLTSIEQNFYIPIFKQVSKSLKAESDAMKWTVFLHAVLICDLILQLVDLYTVQVIEKHYPQKETFSEVYKEKKAFEKKVDILVGEQMEICIGIVLSEVEMILSINSDPFLYDHEQMAVNLQPSKACQMAISYVKQHLALISSLITDRQVINLYAREMMERLFRVIIKLMKRFKISTEGGLQIIADANAYYSFASNFRLPEETMIYFSALKELGNIYIADPTGLKDIIHDQERKRFQDVFRTEDLLELVSLRKDWNKIKGKVETSECVIS